MKKKLLKHIGYLLFILLPFSSCTNEMDMIEDELDLETNNAQCGFTIKIDNENYLIFI